MSGKKFLQEGDRPFFESLWQHGMVGVGEGVVDNVPSLSVVQLLFVKEDAQELNSGDGGVRIVELDLVLGGELRPVISVHLLVASDDVSQGGRAEKVLLLQAQLFTARG